jgi:hypothetical protein
LRFEAGVPFRRPYLLTRQAHEGLGWLGGAVVHEPGQASGSVQMGFVPGRREKNDESADFPLIS